MVRSLAELYTSTKCAISQLEHLDNYILKGAAYEARLAFPVRG